MGNFFENLDDRSKIRAVATVMNGFEAADRQRHWIRTSHNVSLDRLVEVDGPIRRRAFAFLDHAESFAKACRIRDFRFERIADAAWNPTRYFDMHASSKLQWAPLQRWIYDRVGDGEPDGDDYTTLRPLLDPAYRMASAIADDPSVVERAKTAAAPAIFAREDRDGAGDLRGYVVPQDYRSIFAPPLDRDALADEIEFLDDLAAAGLRVDRTSEVERRADGVFVGVPNGIRVRVVGEDLGRRGVALPDGRGNGDVEASVHLRDLRYDGHGYRVRADVEIDGASTSIDFSDRCRRGERTNRFPAEVYENVACQKVNEHRNLMPFLPDGERITPDMARKVRSDWTRRIHAAVFDRLDERFAAAGAR